MSSGAEPEDLDPGCGGKTNAGSPEKKSILLLQFSKFILRKYSNTYESGDSSILIFLFTFQFLQKAAGVYTFYIKRIKTLQKRQFIQIIEFMHPFKSLAMPVQ